MLKSVVPATSYCKDSNSFEVLRYTLTDRKNTLLFQTHLLYEVTRQKWIWKRSSNFVLMYVKFSNSFQAINAFGDPLAVLSPLVVLAISVLSPWADVVSTYNFKNSWFFVRTIFQCYFKLDCFYLNCALKFFFQKKGILPVRWMALESLEDYTYNTKTDV